MTKPIYKTKSGAIDSAIWENESKKDGKTFKYKTISLTRNYTKDEGKSWEHEVINFRPNQLMNLIVVLHEIQRQLFLNQKEETKEEA